MPTYLDFPQLSPEWHAARRGCITASGADKLFGTPAARKKYLMQIAAERLVEEKTDSFTGNYWTERGLALEAEARAAIEFEMGSTVRQVGLCVSDVSPWFRCSPDGLIDEDSILQIKCPAPHTHLGYVLDPKSLAADYLHQVNAELVCTDRTTAFLISYCPGMALAMRVIAMDEVRRAQIVEEIAYALSEVETIIEKVRIKL